MADALSQLAELWGQRKPAAEPTPGGLPPELVQRLLASAEKPKLERDMSFGGAEIQIPIDKVPAKPVSEIQTMEPTVISAAAPSGPESKYNVLNRILGVMQAKEGQMMPDPAMKARVDSTLQNLNEKANAPRRPLDITSMNAQSSDRNPAPEWSQSDYLKAALVATLPALAGGLAGGLGGAMGGSKGGVKGTDEILKQDAELRKNPATKKSDDVKNQISAYRAETDARGKEIKTLADLVKLDVEMNGKISDPMRKFLEKVVPQYAQAEVDIYERELQEQGGTERKIIGEEGSNEREGLRETGRNDRAKAGLTTKEDQFGQSLGEKQRQFNTKLESDEAMKNADRALREKLGKQANATKAKLATAKASGAAKPPNASQGAAAGFAQRAHEANKALEMYTKGKHFNATDDTNVLMDLLPKNLRGFVQTPEHQKFDNAWNEYAAAVLRDETGAAIAEFEQTDKGRAQKPMPGDTEEVLIQKARNRANQIAALAGKAGATAMENAKPPSRLKEDPRVRKAADAAKIPYADARRIYINKGFKLDETE